MSPTRILAVARRVGAERERRAVTMASMLSVIGQ